MHDANALFYVCVCGVKECGLVNCERDISMLDCKPHHMLRVHLQSPRILPYDLSQKDIPV